MAGLAGLDSRIIQRHLRGAPGQPIAYPCCFEREPPTTGFGPIAIGPACICCCVLRLKLVIPIHPALGRSLNAFAASGIHILTDAFGKAIQRRTLTRIIRLAVKQAGLPARCVAHGLRKTALRRLAENGASEKEISAVSGHKSIAEVQRYTKAADQAGLARAAMKRMPNK